jgi:ABC-type sugar transport system ATPase subunit
VLSLREQENLFEIIVKLKRSELLVLYVSHRLDEVFAIADRVTVLRDGREVATLDVGSTSQAELVHMMTGRDARRMFSLPEVLAREKPLLRVRYPHGTTRCEFTLAEGEILGLAGMVGAGRSWLVRRLVGLGELADMTVEVAGRRVKIRSPRQALRHGIVYLTEDRKREGTFSNLSVIGNTTAASLDRFSSFGFLAQRRERSRSAALLDRLGLVARSLAAPARQLSGGNQQKLLLARALLTEPRVLICDEPTRGIDVGAKDEIYEILIELASKGVGIILISSEIKELLAVTHRLLVMRDGAIVAEMATRDADEHTVLAAATGAAASSELEPRNVGGEARPAMSE